MWDRGNALSCLASGRRGLNSNTSDAENPPPRPEASPDRNKPRGGGGGGGGGNLQESCENHQAESGKNLQESPGMS